MQQLNGFLIWEQKGTHDRDVTITVQSVHTPNCAVQTKIRVNAVSFSTTRALRELIEMLEGLENGGK